MARQQVLVTYSSTGLYLSLAGRLIQQVELKKCFWFLMVWWEQRTCRTLALPAAVSIAWHWTFYFHFYCPLRNTQARLIQNNIYFSQNAFTSLPPLLWWISIHFWTSFSLCLQSWASWILPQDFPFNLTVSLKCHQINCLNLYNYVVLS